MDTVLMNLECAFLSVCHFPCSRAEGCFLVPYRFFSHFLTIGLSEMESISVIYVEASINSLKIFKNYLRRSSYLTEFIKR